MNGDKENGENGNGLKSLSVPNSGGKSTGLKSIMDAYKTQSKIQLYDDSSAMAANGIDGVKGRDIPIESLRPRDGNIADDYDIGNGDGESARASRNRYSEDISRRREIRKAYERMNGMDNGGYDEESRADKPRSLDGVEDAEIEYIEDVPDDNEGILHYLETCINNASANLEMLKSLYAALS